MNIEKIKNLNEITYNQHTEIETKVQQKIKKEEETTGDKRILRLLYSLVIAIIIWIISRPRKNPVPVIFKKPSQALQQILEKTGFELDSKNIYTLPYFQKSR